MSMIWKIIAGVMALSGFLGVAYTLDGRWVRCHVYAEGMSAVQQRQLRFEERSVQKDIDDLQDRIENPRIPPERKAAYRERLRRLQQDLKEVQEEKKGKP